MYINPDKPSKIKGLRGCNFFSKCTFCAKNMHFSPKITLFRHSICIKNMQNIMKNQKNQKKIVNNWNI